MKIVEQYLKAVGSRLSWRKRGDIVDELRSLLMDQIEKDFGASPSEKEVREVISAFGSPSAVARRYRGEKPVIAGGFSDLYFMILGILAGALLIAFTTVFLVEILQNPVSGAPLMRRILQIPLQVLSAWFGGVGGVTLIFIFLSRITPGLIENPDDDWDIRELAHVSLGSEGESRLEMFFSVAVLSFLIVLMNVFPGIITALENLFAKSGIPLGHRTVIGVFRNYVYFLSVLWLAGIIISVLKQRRGGRSRGSRLAELVTTALEILVEIIMLRDRTLFSENSGWVGFKVVISILLVVNSAELIAGLYRVIRGRIVDQNRI